MSCDQGKAPVHRCSPQSFGPKNTSFKCRHYFAPLGDNRTGGVPTVLTNRNLVRGGIFWLFFFPSHPTLEEWSVSMVRAAHDVHGLRRPLEPFLLAATCKLHTSSRARCRPFHHLPVSISKCGFLLHFALRHPKWSRNASEDPRKRENLRSLEYPTFSVVLFLFFLSEQEGNEKTMRNSSMNSTIRSQQLHTTLTNENSS